MLYRNVTLVLITIDKEILFIMIRSQDLEGTRAEASLTSVHDMHDTRRSYLLCLLTSASPPAV
jgi:hypothetical protein